MDREKATDWIYGERLRHPAGAKCPAEKRTIRETEERHGLLWHLRRRLPGRKEPRASGQPKQLRRERAAVIPHRDGRHWRAALTDPHPD
jgi:hypothetical protein